MRRIGYVKDARRRAVVGDYFQAFMPDKVSIGALSILPSGEIIACESVARQIRAEHATVGELLRLSLLGES